MAKIKDDLKKTENVDRQIQPPDIPEPNDYSNTFSKRLGNKRWKYQGKTYKEEPLGKA